MQVNDKKRIKELEQRVNYLFENLEEFVRLYEALGGVEDINGRLVLSRLEKIERDIEGIKRAIDYDEKNTKSKYLNKLYAMIKNIERRVG